MGVGKNKFKDDAKQVEFLGSSLYLFYTFTHINISIVLQGYGCLYVTARFPT
jgi:hypothetical protein